MARGGRRQVALVAAEPGAGKSRLAAEFANRRHAEGVMVLFGGAEEEPATTPSFVVYCDVPLTPARSGAVARLIDQAKPAHVSYRLRVKAPPRQGGGSG